VAKIAVHKTDTTKRDRRAQRLEKCKAALAAQAGKPWARLTQKEQILALALAAGLIDDNGNLDLSTLED
jgi:hypothetical protein